MSMYEPIASLTSQDWP